MVSQLRVQKGPYAQHISVLVFAIGHAEENSACGTQFFINLLFLSFGSPLRTRTEQVIVNLCRNAIEAMPDGGRLTIRAENVTLASALAHSHPPLPAGEYVCVAVEDTGVGIAPEVRSRLFDPFVTTKPQGHGLGLAAAYGTVRAHGGAIAVDTEPRQGSTFRIWLPRVRPVEE